MSFRLAATAAFACIVSTVPASADQAFSRAVEKVLMSEKDGRVAELDAARKKDLIACVNTVLEKLPPPKQRYVVEAADIDEMQDRFGEVVMADGAAWKQKITKACQEIVVGG